MHNIFNENVLKKVKEYELTDNQQTIYFFIKIYDSVLILVRLHKIKKKTIPIVYAIF